MTRPQTHAQVIEVIERHLDEAHRVVLRSTTDPGRTLPRFKTKSEAAQDQRAMNVLLALLADVDLEGRDKEQLKQESYARIDGALLAAEDTKMRRRLQGIPEVAPQSSSMARPAEP
jgi:hypothetical protein